MNNSTYASNVNENVRYGVRFSVNMRDELLHNVFCDMNREVDCFQPIECKRLSSPYQCLWQWWWYAFDDIDRDRKTLFCYCLHIILMVIFNSVV